MLARRCRSCARSLHKNLVEIALEAKLFELERSKIPGLQKKSRRDKIRCHIEVARLRRRRIRASVLRSFSRLLLRWATRFVRIVRQSSQKAAAHLDQAACTREFPRSCCSGATK